MDFKLKDLNQKIINFEYEKNFSYEDFFLSKSNQHVFNFLDNWPKWEKNFVNIIGKKFSGKTHLMNIFLKKFKGIKINAISLNNFFLKEIKIYENIILEDITKKNR